MSYEGYVVVLCENGHEGTYDCYDAPDCMSKARCGHCQGRIVWECGVDQTNGIIEDDPGTQAPKLKQIGEEEETCCFCHGSGKRKIPLYEPPTDRGYKVGE